MAERASVEELKAGIEGGDRGVLSRAITLAESRRPDDQDVAQKLIAEILPQTGNARRVGITGVPGAGKSTVIETLGLWLIEQGLKVAVLVIDPSSSRTGGSILGDKTRMQGLSVSPDAYIRPSPSGGVLGGVARKTREAMLLCEAAGFDVILVESVGVGQSEAELAELVDSLCLLLVPGAGDELQGIKRGIMEIADLIVVNKADGDRVPLAKRARGDYRHALRMLPPSTEGWETPVLIASATEKTGLAEIWDTIEAHRKLLEESGLLTERRMQQQQRWLASMIEEAVLNEFYRRDGVAAAIAA
ncbi:MAG: methylmalonyl Co-A mutase-associated GTPase MeaB, partial [Solirubrobacterales bacterium]